MTGPACRQESQFWVVSLSFLATDVIFAVFKAVNWQHGSLVGHNSRLPGRHGPHCLKGSPPFDWPVLGER